MQPRDGTPEWKDRAKSHVDPNSKRISKQKGTFQQQQKKPSSSSAPFQDNIRKSLNQVMDEQAQFLKTAAQGVAFESLD
jgi:hypothetical protein